jgi:hypothetical protein
MPKKAPAPSDAARRDLVARLNEDLSREYQVIPGAAT